MATAYQMIQQLRLETEEGAITPSRLADVLEAILEEGVANGSNTGGTTTPSNPGGNTGGNTGDNTGGNSGDNSGDSNNGDNTGSEESDVYSIKITLSEAGTFSHPDTADVSIPAGVETLLSVPKSSKNDGIIVRNDDPEQEFFYASVDLDPDDRSNVPLRRYLGYSKIQKLYIYDSDESWVHRNFYQFLDGTRVESLIFKYSNSHGFGDLYQAFASSYLKRLDVSVWPDIGYSSLRSPGLWLQEQIQTIRCRQSFKDWALQQSFVPNAIKEGGTCQWIVVDDPNYDPDGEDVDDW